MNVFYTLKFWDWTRLWNYFKQQILHQSAVLSRTNWRRASSQAHDYLPWVGTECQFPCHLRLVAVGGGAQGRMKWGNAVWVEMKLKMIPGNGPNLENLTVVNSWKKIKQADVLRMSLKVWRCDSHGNALSWLFVFEFVPWIVKRA